jgi:hypothetical protein
MENSQKPEKLGSFYTLRTILALIFGIIFLEMLIGSTALIIGYAFSSSQNSWVSNGAGEVMTILITAMLVFGAAHLALAFSIDKRSVELPEKTAKTKRVFTTIYLAILALAAAGFLIALLVPLVGLIFGANMLKGSDLWQMISTCAAAILLIAISAAHFSRIFDKKVPKFVYPATLGGIAAVVVILFAIFPGQEIRLFQNDQQVVDDLSDISYEVTNYVLENNKMPGSLLDLDLDLNRDISNYSYKSLGRDPDSPSYIEYELCADGFKTDSKNKYNNFPHGKGKECFSDLTVYVGSQPLIDEEQVSFESLTISGTGQYSPEQFNLPIGSYRIEWSFSDNTTKESYGTAENHFSASIDCEDMFVTKLIVNDVAASGSGSTLLYNSSSSTKCFLDISSSVSARSNWEFRISATE